jgi:two-component system response regulator RegX3
MSARILIVEDESAIADSVSYALRAEGFDVDAVEDGESALKELQDNGYDLLVIDVLLPGISGLELCRRVRVDNVVPILMLTARTTEVDRVLGLETGADDYVSKPFSMSELISRVRALLRRRELDLGELARLRAGGLELDPQRHVLLVDGAPVEVTLSEFRLLALLLRHPERVFSRRELMQHLWESTYVGDQRAADTHIANLRRKIEHDPARPERLVTVRGAGYKLVAV